MSALTHRDYTVGWICALHIELAAAAAMLDEIHPPLLQLRSDHNAYTLGRVGKHNVVVACLPAGQTGITSAAIVAEQMTHSFRSIRFSLMVGIGGGDMVVSIPGTLSGGVVQYDFGKTVAGGQFIHTGSLNAPPRVLLTALTKLRAMRPRLAHYLSVMDTLEQPEFAYQGIEHDQLFEAEYDHVGDDTTCEQCDSSRLVERRIRYNQDPVVHYGTIASGNGVMKHGATRDSLRREHGVLCFEMEAAGLMNDFPCVVVRGVCDYADSHKNKRWQRYAAATAAAYAKGLLSIMPTEQVANAPAAGGM